MKKILYIALLFFITNVAFSQFRERTLGPWHITSIQGNLNINSFYRIQQTKIAEDDPFNYKYAGLGAGLSIESTSYIWRSDLLNINISGAVNPQVTQNSYLSLPYESRNFIKDMFSARVILIRHKYITIGGEYNYKETYSRFEDLSVIKSKYRNWSTNMTVTPLKTPINVGFSKSNYFSTTTDRFYANNEYKFMCNTGRGFTKYDRSTISYAHDYIDRFRNPRSSRIIVNDRLRFDNYIKLLKKDKLKFHTMVNMFSRNWDGTGDTRTNVSENLLYKLPFCLVLNGLYKYTHLKTDLYSSNLHYLNVSLDHRVYQSLLTSISVDMNRSTSTSFFNGSLNFTGSLNYKKKIILNGYFQMTYIYTKGYMSFDGESAKVVVLDEPVTLTDGLLVLLDKPYVDVNSVVITNADNTAIYQENSDYILIEREHFLEIRRVIGGSSLISNNEMVLVSYLTTIPGSYGFSINDHYLSTNVLLFKNIINIYYNTSFRNFSKKENTANKFLNDYNQQNVGLRISYKHIEAGISYMDRRSTFNSFKTLLYSLSASRKIRRVVGGISASRSHYYYIGYGKTVMSVVSAYANFPIRSHTKGSFHGGYTKQTGDFNELDLITFKFKITTTVRKTYFDLGIDFFKRLYLGRDHIFTNFNLRILRKF